MPTLEIFRDNQEDILSFDAGQVIVQEGAPGETMYAVLEGEVDIIKHGRLLEIVQPVGFFGEMALIDQEPRNASAIARTPCAVACIDRERFLDLVHHHPSFSLQVMKVMADRIRYMSAMV